MSDRELAEVLREIDSIYSDLATTIGFIGSTSTIELEKPFSLSDYPSIKTRVDKALRRLAKKLDIAIVNGVRSQWSLANKKNDELCRLVFGDHLDKLTKAQARRYFNNNDAALSAFITRKENGLSLSNKVWNYAEQGRNEIEAALELGIKTGQDAVSMARDLKQYLKYPDKLFRRIRDKEGNLHLSKNALNFHPGQGVYRSSYKNARRLAATENNIAYSTADHKRYTQLDFIVGFRVNLSQNHTCLDSKGVPQPFHDICDELQGDYPKWFKFVGWHPLCRCFTTTILKTPEEVMRDSDGIDRGSVNEVKGMPPQWNDWLDKNRDRIERSEDKGTLPYFLRDNQWAWKEGVELDVPRPKTALLKAEERHAARTEEQIADIKARWHKRETAYDDARRVLHLVDSIPGLAEYWERRPMGEGETLKKLRYRFNTGKFKSYESLRFSAIEVLDLLRDLRKELSVLDNPIEVMKKWGVDAAFNIKQNVERTMARYAHESDKVKAQKYRFEARWIEENRKDTIPTWKEAQEAYIKAAKELEWNLEWAAFKDDLDALARDPMADFALVEEARKYIGKDKAKVKELIGEIGDNIRLTVAKAKFNHLFKHHPKLLVSFADSMELALDPDDAERVLEQAKVFTDAWDEAELRAIKTKKDIPPAMWDEIQAAIDADDYAALSKLVNNAENYVVLKKSRNEIRDILNNNSPLIENYDYKLFAALQDDLLGGTVETLGDIQLHIKQADNIINEFMDANIELLDYGKYDSKSRTFKALLKEGDEAIARDDLRGLKAILRKLKDEKERIENEKAYWAKVNAEWESMNNYVSKVKALNANDPVLDSLISSFEANYNGKKTLRSGRADYQAIMSRLTALGLKVDRRITIDDLKAQLGDKLPKTIEKLDKSIEQYIADGNYGGAAKRNEKEIEEAMFEWLNKYDLGMNVKEKNLELIRKSWFKCQFETGTSGGYQDSVGDLNIEQGDIPSTHGRLRFTHQMFLADEPTTSKHQLKRKEYEKYGNLMNTDIHSSLHHNHGDSYGRVQVRFKRNMVIATWTPADSLGRRWQPTLVTDPKACGFDSRQESSLPIGMQGADFDTLFSKAISCYCELQYHGDLTMDCVESIAFPYDITKKPSILAEAKEWKALGIKVYYLDSNDKLVEL